MNGQRNIAIGFLTIGAFMLYGFLLIYLRDFAPDKQAWVDSYSVGRHFEARLAHVHGNLFAFLNVVMGYLLLHFGERLRWSTLTSWLGLIGLLYHSANTPTLKALALKNTTEPGPAENPEKGGSQCRPRP